MIRFIRIGHRSLYGQVVFSWSRSLQTNRTLVVNDEAANDEFKEMSLELSKPQGIKFNIFTVENTLTKISKMEALNENIMMIFENTKDVRQFCESYSDVKEINYGGVIKKEGSKQFSNVIFLTENEIEGAKVLKSTGTKQSMQQVPIPKKKDLNIMI